MGASADAAPSPESATWVPIPACLKMGSIVAGPGYNRWLFPPSALLIHLSIGNAYAYSVFNKPLHKLCGKHDTPACRNWSIVEVGWVFTLFFIMLGSSAALCGRWLERMGPRVSGIIAALCWGGGYMLASVAVRVHSLPLLFVGNGVIGGIGLGFGYISPVSTLMKWFPDHRGMATGLAIMGFGGGAVIGAPLGSLLMSRYSLPETFFTMGVIYLAAMLLGALTYRVPPTGWRPQGWVPPASDVTASTQSYVDANTAVRTPQFYLLWVMLCANVSCGIAVLGQASLMFQDLFGMAAGPAAGIVGTLSFFNISGRILWSSFSDWVGRWPVYTCFFVVGMCLYASLPSAGQADNLGGFFFAVAVVLTMYGGGFAAIPAYISDFFGVKQAGAIHGRVLTAWSAAAVIGPHMLNSIREKQLQKGVPASRAYDKTLYILTAILGVGLIANLLVPLADRFFPVQRTQVDPTLQESKEGDDSQHTTGQAKKGGGERIPPFELEGGSTHTRADTHAHTHAHKFEEAWPQRAPSGHMLPLTLLWWCVPMAGFAWGLSQTCINVAKAFR